MVIEAMKREKRKCCDDWKSMAFYFCVSDVPTRLVFLSFLLAMAALLFPLVSSSSLFVDDTHARHCHYFGLRLERERERERERGRMMKKTRTMTSKEGTT